MTDGNSTFDQEQTPIPSGKMEPVGSGATCETWRFQRWGKWFVLKRLRPEFQNDPRLVAALEKEFDLGIRLDHPGMVRYFEKGSDAQGPYLIEEYIDGQTLADWSAEHRPLPDADVRRLMGELCDAVGYLHEAGIVHADLGPGNVLVTRQGSHIKLIDLGFASQYSYAPVAAGTPDFSAPEQFTARKGLDVRADVFALGKLLALLAPGRWRSVVRRATAPDPQKRYASPQALLRALRPRYFALWAMGALLLAALVAAPFLQRCYLRLHPADAQVDTLIVKDTLVIRDTIWHLPENAAPTPPEQMRAVVRREIQRIRAPFYASYGTLTQENFADVQQRHLASFSRASAAADSIARAWSARYPQYSADFAVIPAEELQRDLGRYQGDVLRMERGD